MAAGNEWQERFEDEQDGAVRLRKPHRASDEIDMTPMIDCVFLLLIFFLVHSALTSINAAVELPPAQFGTAADMKQTVVLTMVAREGGQPPEVYLGDPDLQQKTNLLDSEAKVLEAIRQGRDEGKEAVMLRAERTLKHRDVSKVASAVGQVEGGKLKLYLAVFDGE